MSILNVITTFAAALAASVLSLAAQFQPRYRPFGRPGLRFTTITAAWIAVLTTGTVYLAIFLAGGPVPTQVWAFAAPPAAWVMRGAARRGAGSARLEKKGEDPAVSSDRDEKAEDAATSSYRESRSRRLQQMLAQMSTLMIGWLEGKLGELKDKQVFQWSQQLQVRDSDADLLIERLTARLRDRHLPGSNELRERLEVSVTLYRSAHDAWSRAPQGRKRSLKSRLTVAVEDLLCVVYEARADHLVSASFPQPSQDRAAQP